ncbi:MAG: glycosyltransferase family 2 protein [Elusimicrobia bacterium]|nr:glycosyltransferase family 2 protein [Elusimicrobiota bacterium]
MSSKKRVSIITAVFNEQESVQSFYEELQKVLSKLERYEFELLFVDNRSTDRTRELILELRAKDPRVQLLTMSRNFGVQASFQAGFSNATGEATIVIDVDLEDPPELIPTFLEKWEQGYDVVYGERSRRPEPWIVKEARNLFYRLLRVTADTDIVLYMAEFALISENVRKSIINNHNTFPFFRTEIGYAGFARIGVPYERQKRRYGRTHYNVFGMFAFAIAGLLTSSTLLFRAAGWAFFPIAGVNLAFILREHLFDQSFRRLILLDATYLIFLLSVHGVYLARIYRNGIGRPNYILDPKHTHRNAA